MGKIVFNWNLVKKSLSILASDKELIVLPLVSSFLSLVAAAGLYGWYLASNWTEIRALQGHGPAALPYPILFYLLTFVFYVISYFVVVFCNVALIAVANNRMGGGDWKIGDGLALAWQRAGTILQWAIFAATVGILLRMISDRLGWLGRLVIDLIGLAWSLAIYFIVPVLAFENLGPMDALKRSTQLFRKTWGENVVAGTSFFLIFGAPLFLVVGLWYLMVPALVTSMAGAIVAVAILLPFVTLICSISSAASSIFNVALYNYAIGGRLHGGFSEDDFLFAWVPKTKAE